MQQEADYRKWRNIQACANIGLMTQKTRTQQPRRRKKKIDVASLLEESEAYFLQVNIPLKLPYTKRLFDIAFSIFALIITTPLWIPSICIISLTSKGSPIFISPRVGYGGRPIHCYKLRTMYRDAEKRLKALLESSPEFAAEYMLRRKLTADPRITPIGRFLRRYSIDEIPQFLNVILGALSVVGPRPYLARELKELPQPTLKKLLCVRPGLTGPWQTAGRSNIPFKERVAMEITYSKKRSWKGDLGYIAKTIPAMLFPKGAL